MGNQPADMQTTTLWDAPSRHYGGKMQGDNAYAGATPAYVIWNLLQRYTRPGDLVVDPMCGSGTTLDVARELKRKALGYDLQPFRKDIFRSDARTLPVEDAKVDFVFIDPPYSDHIKYSDNPDCIGKLRADTPAYYREMDKVLREIDRILKPGRYMALYVSDSRKSGKPLMPIGFELFQRLCRTFIPVDIIAVTRRNEKLQRNNWLRSTVEQNFFMRGFNYLFIMYKPDKKKAGFPDRRAEEEIRAQLSMKFAGKPE